MEAASSMAPSSSNGPHHSHGHRSLLGTHQNSASTEEHESALDMSVRRIRKIVSLIRGESKKRTQKVNPTKRDSLSGADAPAAKLPSSVWSRIFDYSNPFDVAKWRRVDRKMNVLVSERFSRILYLDLWRMDINDIVPRRKETDGEFWRHKRSQLLLNMEPHAAILVVDTQWTVRDVERFWSAVKAFRRSAQTLLIEAPVAELLVAGLALKDLHRWFSYQAYLNSLQSSPSDSVYEMTRRLATHSFGEVFFPNAKEITIRTTNTDYSTLQRIPAYGVPAAMLFPIENDIMHLFRLNVVRRKSSSGNSSPTQSRPARDLHPFKRWVDTDALRERYSQLYS